MIAQGALVYSVIKIQGSGLREMEVQSAEVDINAIREVKKMKKSEIFR